MRLTRETRLMLTIADLGLALYIVCRYTDLLGWLPTRVARNHGCDLAGGLVFPAYVNVLCLATGRQRVITTWPRAAILTVICCVSWEILAPLAMPKSTADPLDAIAYALGIAIYALVLNRPPHNVD